MSTAEWRGGAGDVGSAQMEEDDWDAAALGIPRSDGAAMVEAVDFTEHRKREDEREPQDAAWEADCPIHKSVEVHDEQFMGREAPNPVNVEVLRSGIKNVAIRDRTPDDHLIKQEQAMFVDAAWLDHFPFLAMANGEAWEGEEDKNAPQSALPVSDDFLQDLLVTDEVEAASEHSTQEIQFPTLSNEDDTDYAAVASQRSDTHDPPSEWCSHPRCPVETQHHAGLYLKSGEAPWQ